MMIDAANQSYKTFFYGSGADELLFLFAFCLFRFYGMFCPMLCFTLMLFFLCLMFIVYCHQNLFTDLFSYLQLLTYRVQSQNFRPLTRLSTVVVVLSRPSQPIFGVDSSVLLDKSSSVCYPPPDMSSFLRVSSLIYLSGALETFYPILFACLVSPYPPTFFHPIFSPKYDSFMVPIYSYLSSCGLLSILFPYCSLLLLSA